MSQHILTQRIDTLRSQLSEYKELLTLPLPDPSTVYIGDGYFVTMSIAEAHRFLNRKIETIELDLSSLSQLVGVNDDGLPVFDIVEELDDDDKVISSKVSQAGLGNELARLGSTERESKSALSPKDEVARLTEIEEPKQESKEQDKVSAEPKKHAESTSNATLSNEEADDDDEVQYIEDVSDYPSDNGEDRSEGEFRDIDPSDVLELELLEDEQDEENIEFNFDDVEEDEDGMTQFDDDFESDDDDSDIDVEGHYGWRDSGGASLFPQNDRAQRAIEAYLSQHKSPSPEAGTPPISEDTVKEVFEKVKSEDFEGIKQADLKKNNGGKSARVHFADNVDVREFETNASERKNVALEPPARQVSRFKVSRSKPTHNSPPAASPLSASSSTPSHSPLKSSKSPNAALAAAAAVAKGPPKNVVHTSTVVERQPPSSEPRSPNSSIVVNKTPSTKRYPRMALPLRKPGALNGKRSNSPLRDAKKDSEQKTDNKTDVIDKDQVTSDVKEKDSVTSDVTEKGDVSSEVKEHDQIAKDVKEKKHTSSDIKEKDHLASGIQDKGAATSDIREHKTSIGDAEESNQPAEVKSVDHKPDQNRDAKAKLAADAERIFEQSFVPDVEFLKLHDKEEANTTNEAANKNDENPSTKNSDKPEPSAEETKPEIDRPILSAVLERDDDEGDEDFEDGYEDHNNEVDMREIKQEYQRLRQKLIYQAGGYKKKESEMAIEPISEDGNPKKVSRFKAARLI